MDGGDGGAAGSCVGTSLSLYPQLRGGREGAGRGLFNFILKDIVCAKCFPFIFYDSAYPWCI